MRILIDWLANREPFYLDSKRIVELCLCAEIKGLDYIITRNLKDFQNCQVQALSPEEFLTLADMPAPSR